MPTKYAEHRYKEILEYLHKHPIYMTIGAIAMGTGYSWNTIKNDLKYLADQKFIKRKLARRKIKKYKFMFNFEKI